MKKIVMTSDPLDELPEELVPDMTWSIKVFRHLKRYGKDTRTGMMKKLVIDDRSLRRVLESLRTKGLIKADKQDCLCGNTVNFWEVVKSERKKR